MCLPARLVEPSRVKLYLLGLGGRVRRVRVADACVRARECQVTHRVAACLTLPMLRATQVKHKEDEQAGQHLPISHYQPFISKRHCLFLHFS